MTKINEGYSLHQAEIAEMSSDGQSALVDVPIAQELIDQLKEGDENPMFVTLEVLNERVSNNGNDWTKAAIVHVCEQINANKPDGYWGHLTKEERSHKYPDPQTIWLGAVVKEVNGKARLFAKGYVLPDATKARSYLKKAKAAGKNVAVSVFGKVRATTQTGLRNMANFVLESIDWARPGSEGVQNSGLWVVTQEMTERDNKDVKDDGVGMTKEEALKSATASELREHNPALVDALVSEMTTEAVQAKEAELETQVQEMGQLKEIVPLKDGQTLAQAIQEMRTGLRNSELEAQLNSKVESKAARKFVKELVLAEMTEEKDVTETVDKVLATDAAQSLIQEMVTKAPKVQPRIDRPVLSARKYTKKR